MKRRLEIERLSPNIQEQIRIWTNDAMSKGKRSWTAVFAHIEVEISMLPIKERKKFEQHLLMMLNGASHTTLSN